MKKLLIFRFMFISNTIESCAGEIFAKPPSNVLRKSASKFLKKLEGKLDRMGTGGCGTWGRVQGTERNTHKLRRLKGTYTKGGYI